MTGVVRLSLFMLCSNNMYPYKDIYEKRGDKDSKKEEIMVM